MFMAACAWPNMKVSMIFGTRPASPRSCSRPVEPEGITGYAEAQHPDLLRCLTQEIQRTRPVPPSPGSWPTGRRR